MDKLNALTRLLEVLCSKQVEEGRLEVQQAFLGTGVLKLAISMAVALYILCNEFRVSLTPSEYMLHLL